MQNFKIARALRVLDYVVGAATIGYGVISAQPLFIGGGIAGLALAHLNLSDRIERSLRKYFSRKDVKPAAPAPELVEVSAAMPSGPIAGPSYAAMRLQVGPVLTSQSQHSALKTASHLNHASMAPSHAPTVGRPEPQAPSEFLG